MADRADIESLDVLRDLRAALCTFMEDAKNALADVDFDIRRMREWLSNEQRLFWQNEIRRWQQNLSMAKTELHRKKLAKFLDHKPDTSQEEKAVKYAQMRLDEAMQKLETVKRWVPELQHAVQEYRGTSQPLASMVEVDLLRGVTRFDRMIEALEAYLQLAAPQVAGAGDLGAGPAASMSRDAPTSADAPSPSGTAPTPATDPEDAADERQRRME